MKDFRILNLLNLYTCCYQRSTINLKSRCHNYKSLMYYNFTLINNLILYLDSMEDHIKMIPNILGSPSMLCLYIFINTHFQIGLIQ